MVDNIDVAHMCHEVAQGGVNMAPVRWRGMALRWICTTRPARHRDIKERVCVWPTRMRDNGSGGSHGLLGSTPLTASGDSWNSSDGKNRTVALS